MCRRAMRDPNAVEAKLVTLVRELSRRAGRAATEEEARAALAPLSADEEQELLEYAQHEPPARPLGPMAWADVARGTAPQTAAARELTGYYALQVERDALAQMLTAKDLAGIAASGAGEGRSAERRAPKVERTQAAVSRSLAQRSERNEPTPRVVALTAKPVETKPLPTKEKKAKGAPNEERAGQLLTLFAYHRDTALVAKALGWSLDELTAEVDRLQLKRKTGKLLRGLDTEMPVATSRKSSATAPVLRRSAKEKQESAARKEAERALAAIAAQEEQSRREKEPPASKRIPGRRLATTASARATTDDAAKSVAQTKREPLRAEKHERAAEIPSAAQGEELRAVLREVGPRRGALATRLGTTGRPLSPAALLARFRAAGLEREFGQRERDLIRALVSRHRGAFKLAAADLGTTRHELEELIRERGLARELEALRERQRTTARAARWPKASIALLLEKKEWLADLGLLDELEADARARVQLIWKDLPAGSERIDALAKALGVRPGEAQALATQLSLR
jgi:hypothetical protein